MLETCASITFSDFQRPNGIVPELFSKNVPESRLYIGCMGRGGLRLCGAPGWNLERGPFYIYKTVVNREKINERTEVFVLFKQKKLEQKETYR